MKIRWLHIAGCVLLATIDCCSQESCAQDSLRSRIADGERSLIFSSSEIESPFDTTSAPYHETAGWLFSGQATAPWSESVLPVTFVEQSQPPGGNGGAGGSGGSNSGGGGAGAAAATNPSVPLAQFQVQNVFVPETYDAAGYSNTTILQPVVPLQICENAFFPYHIIRPTLPIIAPTADPDGPRGVHGGLGDLTVLDIYVRPLDQLKSAVAVGYAFTAPTRTHPALGRGEWEFGPSFAAITQAVPKWNIGFLYEQLFSLESDNYQILFQPVIVRTLPDEWYVGWGDLLMKLDDQDGGYNLPINGRVGKVVKFGETPVNIFIQPSYTPDGLRSGPGGDIWSIKLNVTLLFPGADLKAPILNRLYH